MRRPILLIRFMREAYPARIARRRLHRSMNTLNHFEEPRIEVLHEIIRRQSPRTLVTAVRERGGAA